MSGYIATPWANAVTSTEEKHLLNKIEKALGAVQGFDSLAEFASVRLPSSIQTVWLRGYATCGDGGHRMMYWQNGDLSAEVGTSPGLYLPTLDDPLGESGAWVTLHDGVINVRWCGALPNAENCSTALAAALGACLPVYFPGTADPTTQYYAVSSAVATAAARQRIFGEGRNSRLVQLTEDANVIAVAHDDCEVDHLHIQAVGTKTTYIDGCGVKFSNCARGKAHDLYVTNHQGGGVLGLNVTDMRIRENTFEDSTVDQDNDDHTEVSADIAIYGDCVRNHIIDNDCISGQGVGITLQTTGITEKMDNNLVMGNTCEGCGQYGINVYRATGVTTGSVERNVISANIIKNITGSIPHATSGYIYGAGIYIQGAEGAIVEGNNIYNTHSGAVAHTETLAPGGIGCANVTKFTLADNTIDLCGECGIFINDTNQLGSGVGTGLIKGNNITNVAHDGILTRDAGNLTITENTIDDCDGIHGIWVDNSGDGVQENIKVSDNDVRNVAGSGVFVDYATNPMVNANRVNTAGQHGVVVSNSTDVVVNGNTVLNQTSIGVYIRSSNTRANMNDNTVRGSGGSSVGFTLDVLTHGDAHGNRASNCASNWAGTYAMWQTTAPSSGTWEVGYKVWFPNTAAGGMIGWDCTNAATPTFKTWGPITA